MGRNYTAIINERIDATFPTVLNRFLADLPPEGWEGTSPELHEFLTAWARPGETVPKPNNLVRELASRRDLFAAARFAFRCHRTMWARIFIIERVKGEKRTARNGALNC